MDGSRFDALARHINSTCQSRRQALAIGASLVALAGDFALHARDGAARRRKKRHKHHGGGGTPPPPPPPEAVVASLCVNRSVIGSSDIGVDGQPFAALRGGPLDRAEVTLKRSPGGDFAFEIRDLNQGHGISTAPIIASATVSAPPLDVSAGDAPVPLTARFATEATLIAGDRYALVVRNLQAERATLEITVATDCPGEGELLRIPAGETTFQPVPGLKLVHSIYVIP